MSHVISTFYGMTVLMSLQKEDRPHFEVVYDGNISKFSIEDGTMYEGDLIQDGQDIINEWYMNNKYNLKQNWELLLKNKKPLPISPIL
jgi:hypothetical protein